MTEITTRDGELWLKTLHADLLVPFEGIPANSVDLVFTSPPYKKRDGYTDALMRALGALALRVLKPTGRLMVNFAQLSEDFTRLFNVPPLIRNGSVTDERACLEQAQTYIWSKTIAIGETTHGHLQPINSTQILAYCWEAIFTFTKERPADLDRLAVGVPFMDKSNLTRGNRGKNGDIRDAGDLWFVPYETKGKTKKKAHPYEFPAKLVQRAIRVSGLEPGSVVMDCFAGSGQTAVVAKQEGHNAWLIDLNGDRLEEARQRWKAA